MLANFHRVANVDLASKRQGVIHLGPRPSIVGLVSMVSRVFGVALWYHLTR